MVFFAFMNLIAIVGYYCFFKNVLKQNEAFFPFCFIAFSVVVVYIFGCMELLSIGCVAVIIGGIVSLLICVLSFKEKKEKPDHSWFFNPTVIFMGIGIVWSFILSRGIIPSHYDDFSHWLRLCKTMHADGSYPCTSECYYVNYVPGTATWVYYYTRGIGYSIENCYFSQMILNLSCCAGFFSVVDKNASVFRKAVFLCVNGLLAVLLCSMNVTTYSLLVDGTLALASVITVIYVITTENEENKWLRFGIILVLSCFIAIIKASGILFTIFISVLFFVARRNIKGEKHFKEIACSLCVIIVPYLLSLGYLFRAKRIYGTGTWKQGTAEEYIKILTGWDSDRYLKIVGKMISACMDYFHAVPQIKMLWYLFIIVTIISLLKIKKGKEDRQWGFVVGYMLVVSVLWMVGVLFTYFTYNEEDAYSLVCFERYTGTIVIFEAGLILFYVLLKLNKLLEKKKFLLGVGGSLSVAIAISLLAGFNPAFVFGFKYFDDKTYTVDAWAYLAENYEERWDFNNDSYALIVDVEQKDLDNYYKLHQVMTTYFRTTNCAVYDIHDLQEHDTTIEEIKAFFSYVIYYMNVGDQL